MTTVNTVQIYDLAIQIEQKVSQLYSRFSALFRNDLQTSRFWTQLAHQEKAHAEALMRGKVSLLGGGGGLGNGKSPNPPTGNSSELEAIFEKVREHERTVRKQKPTLHEALAMMLEIENGEIHRIYNSLVQPSAVPAGRGDTSSSPREHALMIKEFLSRIPAGTPLVPQGASLLGLADSIPKPSPIPRKPEGVRTKIPASPASPKEKEELSRDGKIADVVPAMGYGLIEGEDGRQYLYLIGGAGHEIPEAEQRTPGRQVRFGWIDFPWGPRATRIRGR